MIAILCAEQNFTKLTEHTRFLSDAGDTFSQLSMWRLKAEVLPQLSDPPSAKLDLRGNLITNPKALKTLYVETYVKRLESQKVDPKMKNLFSLKMELWERIMKKLEKKSSANWTTTELDRVLKNLKNNIK